MSKNPNIYVGGIPSDIKESELRGEFSKYGRINKISVKPRFCFIEFDDYHSAEDAIYEVH